MDVSLIADLHFNVSKCLKNAFQIVDSNKCFEVKSLGNMQLAVSEFLKFQNLFHLFTSTR